MPLKIDTVPKPPMPGNERRQWGDIAARAKQETPEWVVVEDVGANIATRIRKGQMKAFPNPDEWEVVTRNNTRNNRCTLFLKYTR